MPGRVRAGRGLLTPDPTGLRPAPWFRHTPRRPMDIGLDFSQGVAKRRTSGVLGSSWVHRWVEKRAGPDPLQWCCALEILFRLTRPAQHDTAKRVLRGKEQRPLTYGGQAGRITEKYTARPQLAKGRTVREAQATGEMRVQAAARGGRSLTQSVRQRREVSVQGAPWRTRTARPG